MDAPIGRAVSRRSGLARRLRAAGAVAALAGPLLLAGCIQQVVRPGAMAQVAPMLSVERFLQASNARDLDAMARMFGTADGPLIETGSTLGCAFRKMGSWIGLGQRCVTRAEVELRMDVIARILQHEDFRIVGESVVAGRRHPTTRISVELTQAGVRYPDVPFVVVRTPGGSWLVQEIDLTRITAAGSLRRQGG